MNDRDKSQPLGRYNAPFIKGADNIRHFIDNTLPATNFGVRGITAMNIKIDNETNNEDGKGDDFYRRAYLTQGRQDFTKRLQSVFDMVFKGLQGLAKDNDQIVLRAYSEHTTTNGVLHGLFNCDMWISTGDTTKRTYGIFIQYNEFNAK